MPVLVDTGILYALADRDDDWHGRAVEYSTVPMTCSSCR